MVEIEISVVVPAYEEAACLPETVAALTRSLEDLGRPFEVVVVDDGSRDGTREVLDRLSAEDARIRPLHHPENRGKGAAVRSGVAAARGARIVYLDADLSTELSALRPLLRSLDAGCDFALGSRRVPGSLVALRQPRLRQWLGQGFSALAALLIRCPVRDFTCGFKGLRAEAARAIFAHSRVDGWAFDPELVAIARDRGLTIEEVPVRWHDQPGSKVRIGRAVVRSFTDLVAVAWRSSRGAYRVDATPAPASVDTPT